MNDTRETERAELHKTIWRIANDLRGSVDGWDFKSYVLGMLFYRFISENLTGYLNEQERRAGSPGFDYARLSDADAEFGRAATVNEKGFYILPSELFANVRARASGLEVIITSALESACGIATLAHLAAAVAPEAVHGLATGDWLAGDAGLPPRIVDGRMRLPAGDGAGFMIPAQELTE